jgi:hypothetical protein
MIPEGGIFVVVMTGIFPIFAAVDVRGDPSPLFILSNGCERET